jgi:hypothetical protein
MANGTRSSAYTRSITVPLLGSDPFLTGFGMHNYDNACDRFRNYTMLKLPLEYSRLTCLFTNHIRGQRARPVVGSRNANTSCPSPAPPRPACPSEISGQALLGHFLLPLTNTARQVMKLLFKMFSPVLSYLSLFLLASSPQPCGGNLASAPEPHQGQLGLVPAPRHPSHI